MTREEAKVKTFDVLHFVADNAGLSIFEAIEKAYNMGVSEQEPCEDCISRETARRIVDSGRTSQQVIDMILATPPVTPQPKMGRWIRISPAKIYECSECSQNVMTSDICAYKFCHGCGAKMESEE